MSPTSANAPIFELNVVKTGARVGSGTFAGYFTVRLQIELSLQAFTM